MELLIKCMKSSFAKSKSMLTEKNCVTTTSSLNRILLKILTYAVISAASSLMPIT